MIIRPGQDELVLVTQPNHARLAGQIMSAWTHEALPSGSRRDMILRATAGHDDGWKEVDVSPLVDASGMLLDFVHAPDEVKQAIWPRCVRSHADAPYVAALIAQHALQVHDGNRENPSWQRFFEEMERARNRNLALVPPLGLHELLHDYAFVRTGDLLSLAFCNGWLDSWQTDSFTFQWDGAVLRTSPDPYGGQAIPFSVDARRLPKRRFASPADAEAAFAAAQVVTLTGIARGQ